ncbi:MAG: hypothetical protein JO038_05165 [Alphaproteobacteria bacterium]|nr:hypothetical protein [Alphaproteobacteria bacterium]
MKNASSLLPASAEARSQGCTCPDPQPGVPAGARDPLCPVHGLRDNRAGEIGPIDTEGDIADSAEDQVLRRD